MAGPGYGLIGEAFSLLFEAGLARGSIGCEFDPHMFDLV